MPIGCTSLVPMIAYELMTLKPTSVLDMGIGMGFYGATVRQWLDFGVQPWRTLLVGVEGFSGYRNPCWDLYDDVTVASISEYLSASNSQWDAILLLDVLEHFEHEVGEQIMSLVRQRLSPRGRLYVGTPAVWMEQGAAYGNEFERHRSLWTVEEFKTLGFMIIHDGTVDRFGNQMLLASAEKA